MAINIRSKYVLLSTFFLFECIFKFLSSPIVFPIIKCIIPSLTVDRRKNRCSPCIYWTTAIFTVVTDYSNLFLSLTFFLNRPHFTFGYELIVCPETTGVMKIICDRFPSI